MSVENFANRNESFYDYVEKNLAGLERDSDEALKKLFKVQRSIVSDGFHQSISILEDIFSTPVMEIDKYPTGSSLNGWTVPKKWSVKEFYINDEMGKKILNFADSNLRIVIGSQPFSGWINPKQHLINFHTHKKLPDAIPYVTNYYHSDTWGVCLTVDELNSLLRHDRIYVNIDIDSTDSDLLVARKKYGESQYSTILWSYLCHPQMANNELSGPIALFILIKLMDGYLNAGGVLSNSYRFAISAETIGSIFYINSIKSEISDISHCHVLTCIGAPSKDLTIQESKKKNSIAERFISKAIHDCAPLVSIRHDNFLLRGSDERQFCWPGIDIPTSYFCTKKYHKYDEYHTSKDDLSFVTSSQIVQSAMIYAYALYINDTNTCPKSTSSSEPMLSSLGLWHTINSGGKRLDSFKVTDFLIFCDGRTSLLDISEILGVSYREVHAIYQSLSQKGLVSKEVER